MKIINKCYLCGSNKELIKVRNAIAKTSGYDVPIKEGYKMQVMRRMECIDIVNRLKEFNLLTDTQAQNIVRKRDEQRKHQIEESKKLPIKRRERFCAWCGNQIKGSGTFFCSPECSRHKLEMDWSVEKQCYTRKK